MKKMTVAFIALGLLAASAYVVKNKWRGGNVQDKTPTSVAFGSIAPDFTLKDLDGKDVQLSSLRGKAVVLNFWATWCPPCREEIPDLIQLQKKYERQGLTVLGVSMDENDDEGVKAFVKKNNMNYPIVFGNEKLTSDYGGIRAIPTTFIINREGKIIEKIVGGRGLKEFEEAVRPAL